MDSVKENQTKKEYLKQYGESKKAIKTIDIQIKEVNTCDVQSGVYINTLGNKHAETDLSDYMEKKEKLIRNLIKERTNWINISSEIYGSINELDNEDEKQVLTLRYISGMKWEDIAKEMHIEWAQLHRIHSRALKNLKI